MIDITHHCDHLRARTRQLQELLLNKPLVPLAEYGYAAGEENRGWYVEPLLPHLAHSPSSFARGVGAAGERVDEMHVIHHLVLTSSTGVRPQNPTDLTLKVGECPFWHPVMHWYPDRREAPALHHAREGLWVSVPTLIAVPPRQTYDLLVRNAPAGARLSFTILGWRVGGPDAFALIGG